jgi:alkanesulfonate monooxygenase SsuD/methylene tetrahydromethanopterin reductase-like flavin-dependent oxidoreductase (luciferase family)
MTEEGIDVLRLAWADGPFSYHGKRYDIDNVDVHPKPVQPGGPPLWIAAMSTAGALRAARLNTNLLPQGRPSEVLDPYREAVEASGRSSADARYGRIRSMYVTDDRERDWPMLQKAEWFRMSVYETFMADTPDDYAWGDPTAISQRPIVGTVNGCVDRLVGFIRQHGITDLASSGLPPGIDPDFMAANVERLANEVVPAVREALSP